MKFEFSPHIAVQVKDHEQSIRFYEEVLGMEKVKSTETETHFRKDNFNFYMESSDQGAVFFEFRVEDIRSAKELLEKEGCRITQVYSDKSLMIADPYGMRFHIWQD